VKSSAASPSPYTGQPPNHAVEIGLIQLAGYLTMGIPNNGKPPAFLRLGLTVTRSLVNGTPVYTLKSPGSTSQEAIIALHGGGYVNEISTIQWIGYAILARDTKATVVVPVYPLAPKGTAAVVVPQVAGIIAQAITDRGADNVSVLGDSAGGGLALAAVQELVRNGSATPSRMVLLSPWLDVTISDPESEEIHEPAISKAELRHDGLLWAGDLDANDPLVSPINGSLDGLPDTYVYAGSRDYLSPQTIRLSEKAPENFTFILRYGEIHDWASYFFLPTAIADRPAIKRQLLGS
jgi:acetyl esterase/lipase